MPKIRTNRAAAKRFSKTARGKYRRARASKGHLLEHKSSKCKRNLRGTTIVAKSDEKRLAKMLPNL